MKTMREGWWAVEDEPKLKLKTASLKEKEEGKEKMVSQLHTKSLNISSFNGTWL